MKRILIYIGITLMGFVLHTELAAQAFMPTWTSVSSNLLINQSTNVLIKNGVNGWNCGARSQEVLASGSDGWVELRFTAYNKSGANGAFGLASTNPDYGFAYMEYAFYVTATSASAYASGSLLATSTIATNDVLRISKSGSTVSFLVNGSAIATRTITTPVNLFVDMGIRNHSCYMQGLVCSFGTYQSHAWNTLNAMTESGGQLTRTGSSAASAYSKNFLPPSQTGFIEYTNLTSHSHGGNWYWGFSTTSGAYTTWPFAVRINANSDSAAFYGKGALLTSFAISNNDILRLDYVGDRVVLSQNNTVKSDQNHFTSVPLVFSISSPGTSGNAIYNADFSMSFASTNQYLHVTTTEVDGDTPATATLTDYGFGSGTKESLWADDFVTRAEWDAEWAALDPEIRQLLDTLPYDDVFATKSMTLGFSEPGDAKVWFHQLSPDVLVSANYKIANKSDVKTNTGYVFTDNVISKSTTSTGRFLLENGSIPGATDGEISFQIFQASATVRVGFSPIGSNAISNGSHMTHFFSVNAGNVFPVVNGTSITINRAYGLGDILTIRITGTSMQFLINATVVHTATLTGTENLQAEVFYNTNPTTNKTFVKVMGNTLTNVHSGKSVRVVVTHANCSSNTTGSAKLNFVPGSWGSSVTYNIKDVQSNVDLFTNLSGSNWTNIPPGEYIVTVFSGQQQLTTLNFLLGYEVDWEFLYGNNMSSTGTGNNRLFSHTNSSSWDAAYSKNALAPGASGWISWDYKNVGPTSPLSGVLLSLRNILSSDESINCNFTPLTGLLVESPGIPICSNSNFAASSQYFTPYHIKWNEDEIAIKRGSQQEFICARSLGDSFKRMYVLFRGTSGQIKNAAASFCPTVQQYADLKKSLDNGYFCVNDTNLPVRYFEQYNDQNGKLSYSIYDEYRNVIVSSTSDINVQYGTNYLNLPLPFMDSGYYILEITNSKNEVSKLRFKV